jgi:uncharacterized protein
MLKRSPSTHHKPMPSDSKRSHGSRRNLQASSPEIVDPSWILKALGITVVVAGICGYLTLCGMFYFGQWQLALSPSRTVAHTPIELGLAFSEVHFAPDAAGQPQLDGWWIPSQSPADPTALMLHSGAGSMTDAIQQARQLHDAHLNVLLFDYRGFGRSSGQHPTQVLMQQDAESALSYLTSLKQIALQHIVVYGEGVGASLATQLCADHHDIAALILNDPEGDLLSRARQDSRARAIPASLLFHETFPLAGPLHQLATPKLLITHSGSTTPSPALQQSADPKMTVELPPNSNDAALQESIRRFLDTYIRHPPQQLTPAP